MEAVLLTIALLYMIWSVAVLVFDADIWLKNKLKADKPKYEAKESPLYINQSKLYSECKSIKKNLEKRRIIENNKVFLHRETF